VSSHVVVDGSNIATEGRQTPSLAQLEGALEELRRERPDASVTVVVDATFAHRIDPSEVPHYEELVLRGEMVSPPAGAIGRGDAFLLRIAEKVSGVVLSNDSFQEFHGEHPWLFEQGRLVGATPVPGIGWIFSARQPVRGPRSRVAVRDTRRARDEVVQAIEVATREVVEPDDETRTGNRIRRPRSRSGTPTAVNDPMTFISFIADHRLGSEIEAEVESFTSHGAVVRYGEVRCYAPLSNLADPPPRSAREVLRREEVRSFVITALDPFRRGIELALPGLGTVTGVPSEETIEAEVQMARQPAVGAGETADAVGEPARRARRRSTPKPAALPPVESAREVVSESDVESTSTAPEPADGGAGSIPAAAPAAATRRGRGRSRSAAPVAAPAEATAGSDAAGPDTAGSATASPERTAPDTAVPDITGTNAAGPGAGELTPPTAPRRRGPAKKVAAQPIPAAPASGAVADQPRAAKARATKAAATAVAKKPVVKRAAPVRKARANATAVPEVPVPVAAATSSVPPVRRRRAASAPTAEPVDAPLAPPSEAVPTSEVGPRRSPRRRAPAKPVG
jgi:hypothetical protein